MSEEQYITMKVEFKTSESIVNVVMYHYPDEDPNDEDAYPFYTEVGHGNDNETMSWKTEKEAKADFIEKLYEEVYRIERLLKQT